MASFVVNQTVRIMSKSGKKCNLIAPIEKIDIQRQTITVRDFLDKEITVPFTQVRSL